MAPIDGSSSPALTRIHLRFKVVSDPKDADLIFRISNRDETQRTFVGSAQATGFVTTGSVHTVLDVVQPNTGKVVWSKAHSWSKSWNTKTAATGVVKDLRKSMEEQEKVASLNK
jgi:hypothetical protein